MKNNILNYVVKFTLTDGFKSCTEINKTTKEGLELGFLDVHEVVDINWIIEENELNKEAYVESWVIEKLAAEDIIDLGF